PGVRLAWPMGVGPACRGRVCLEDLAPDSACAAPGDPSSTSAGLRSEMIATTPRMPRVAAATAGPNPIFAHDGHLAHHPPQSVPRHAAASSLVATPSLEMISATWYLAVAKEMSRRS